MLLNVLRHADPEADGAACAAIYAPYVLDSIISFEEEAPDAREMGGRIGRLIAAPPWLVAERDGRVAGFACGAPHRDRAGYRWAADVSVYVDPAQQRRGVGRELMSRCSNS